MLIPLSSGTLGQDGLGRRFSRWVNHTARGYGGLRLQKITLFQYYLRKIEGVYFYIWDLVR